ncbi:MAG: luciferase-like protein [Frankiales bacterium]|jgi:G6PDH family F420-dependent oxidoreductase|nr:luciferase-like protein [Frankiales bacterium]
MLTLGYALSSEEHAPRLLVDFAARAEQAGFRKLWISDHFHPWNDEQGQSPFVWSVIGGIAATTSQLEVYTAVTCPTVRIHPAIIAQAAATSASMLGGRFGLGIGSGEALNEHVFGDAWPSADVRLAMLEESIEVMRELWTGEVVSHRGEHYTVENARLYTLPEQPPGIWVSGFGPKATRLAARTATGGYVNTSPDAEMLQLYRNSGGTGTSQASVKVCWAEDASEALDTIYRLWPNSGLPGELAQVLPTPQHFMQASQLVTRESVADKPHGPDPAAYLEQIRAYADAGYDELYLHQIGADQEGFFDFVERELLPALGDEVRLR